MFVELLKFQRKKHLQKGNRERTMRILPSILSDQSEVVAHQLELLHSLSSEYEVDAVQMDILDGEYADNVTISPLDLYGFNFKDLKVDLHLMTIEPLDYVYEAKELADEVAFNMIIGQVERMSSQEDFVQEVKKQHWLPGLSLDAYTPVEELSRRALEDVRVVQIMGIQAGFQGQKFIEHTYKTIADARALLDQVNPDIELIVDGGVKPVHLSKLEELGVDTVVVGSVLWNTKDIEAAFDSLYDGMMK